MTIRPFQPADLESVAELFDAYRQFYRQPPNLHACKQWLVDRLAARESTLFVAHDAECERLVGFVQLYPGFSSVSLKRVVVLNDLFVLELARRRGIAEALVRRAEQHARDIGAKGLTLCTELSNTGAQQLYESLGWHRDPFLYYYKNL